VIQTVELRGGSHDGERHQDKPGHPDTLFKRTTDDGERFARSGEVARDDDGMMWFVFQFDPDGHATEDARRRFSGAPTIGP
jgi:hypothetical protein